jgi:hypothetical protein
MSERALFPDEKDQSEFEDELEGVFRIKHRPDPTPKFTFVSPGLNTVSCPGSRPLRWLWQDKIPLGKLTLIEGPPAVGKLFVALDIAARMSTAKPWPDGAPAGEVAVESGVREEGVLQAGEDKERGRQGDTEEGMAESQIHPTPPDPPLLRGGECGGKLVLPLAYWEKVPDESMTRAERDSLQYARAEGLIDEPDPPAVRYVPPPDYVPPKPGPLPSGCVPHDAPREATPVVIVCDAWEADDMIYPRLDSLGADRKNIGTFTEVRTSDSQGGQKRIRRIGFPLDLMMIEYIVREHRGCRMIVIDNLDQYCRTPQQLREAIKLLDEAALYHTLAIVATIQRNVKVTKQGELRDTSRKEDGIARCIWCVTPDPSHPGLLRLEPKRMAFCKKPQGIAFRITDAGQVAWEPLPPYERPPTEAAQRKAEHHHRALVWLTGIVGSGVVHSQSVIDEGSQEGYSRNKLIECRQELKIRIFKVGFGKKKAAWLWTRKPAEEVTREEIRRALAEERGAKREERNGDDFGTLNEKGGENGGSDEPLDVPSGEPQSAESIFDLDQPLTRAQVRSIFRGFEAEKQFMRNILGRSRRHGRSGKRRRKDGRTGHAHPGNGQAPSAQQTNGHAGNGQAGNDRTDDSGEEYFDENRYS